jgi:diaminopimelate decarboxylase
VSLIGLHVHIGSQIVELEPLRRAAGAVAGLAIALRRDGIGIEHLDVGGGLGVSYEGGPVPTIADYVDAVRGAAQASGLALIVEPGRAVIAPAGALLAGVVDVKRQTADRVCVVLDAGMTELMRPALYGAYHRIEPLEDRGGDPLVCDFVGPVCESSDVVAGERVLPGPFVGDRFAVLDAGAYGFTMASNYNRRPLPAEVLVDGSTWRVIRRRQTLDDLLALEL